ncbi:MAG: GNAT family N-acetyltransferase [Lachnospiraceae bacterium]|nr:GNAT family N-acetyltransferase [Lachnospiraceae bacterium]
MEIRQLKKEERFEARKISVIAFHESMEDPQKEREESEKVTDEDWGAFADDGTLMAHIINNRFDCYYEGELIKNGGIGAVSTLPEYRASGAITAIFRELLPHAYQNGEIISTLYPFNHAFYRKVGYETICWQNEYEFTPEILKNYRFGGEAILWKEGDPVSEFTEIYERFARKYNLAIRRSDESMLKAHMKGDCYRDRKFSYLLKEDGEAVGYLIFQDNKTETGAHLTVKDLAFIGRKGFLAILGFLARFQADYEKITLFLPRDLELLSVIQSPNAYAIQKRGRQEYMARIINAKELLSRMRKPDGTSFVIRITDDIIRENEGTFLVEGKKVMQTQEKPDLIVSERALAQLVTGSVSLQESSYREDVEICDKTAVLETVFVSKPILVEDHF